MARLRYLCMTVAVILLMWAPPAGASSNLLANGDFSGGFAPHPAVSGVVAYGWTPFASGSQPPSFADGAGGDAHAQLLSGSGPYTAGVFQRVEGLAVGARYRAGFEVYPACDQAVTRATIGMDPLGGTNPDGFVAWSAAGQLVGAGRRLEISFTAATPAVTIFLRVEQGASAAVTSVAFDNAFLRLEGESEIYLPLIRRSAPPTPTPTSTATDLPTATRMPTATPTPTATGVPAATDTPTATPTPTATGVPAASATPTATQTVGAEPTLLWDARLDELHVRVDRVADARYRCVGVFMTQNGSWDGVPSWAWQYVDQVTGGGGDHHMFAGVYKLDGSPQAGKTVVFSWLDGNQVLTTDEKGWCNAIAQAVYYPDQGQTGPYTMQPLRGDKLVGGGMPYGQHVSIFGVWRELPAGTPTATPTHTATATVTPTITPSPTGPTQTPTCTPTPSATPTGPTPTPTSTGTPGWQFQADGIIVGRPSCSETALSGTIRDEAGAPLAGVHVKVWSPEWGAAISAPSGADGAWRVHIADAPYRAHWQAAVVDEAGELLSPIAGQMYTSDHWWTPGIPTSENCSDGHQLLTINWRQRTHWDSEFVVASARYLSCEENHFNHGSIHTWVVNRDGVGINQVYIAFRSPGGDYPTDQYTGRDVYRQPAGYLCYTMGGGDERSAQVWRYGGMDRSSDLVEHFNNGWNPPVADSCGGNTYGHRSYQVVFQARQQITLLRWLPLF